MCSNVIQKKLKILQSNPKTFNPRCNTMNTFFVLNTARVSIHLRNETSWINSIQLSVKRSVFHCVCVFDAETECLNLVMPTCPLMLHVCPNTSSAELYKMPTMEPLCPVLTLVLLVQFVLYWVLECTLHINIPFHLEYVAGMVCVEKPSRMDRLAPAFHYQDYSKVCKMQFSQP